MGNTIGTNAVTGSRPRGLSIVAALMILFGLAEVLTGFTHSFFGVATAEGFASAYAGAAVGALYVMAGLLVLPMRKWSFASALALLAADVIGRLGLVLTGLYPTNSFKQIFAMAMGTAIVMAFGLYIASKWRSFN